jgi:glycosyltransferase involved in cell wall biosynthesis
MGKPSITVLIPGYNESTFLADSLRAVLAAGAKWGGSFHALYFDNSSTDKSLEIALEIAQEHPELKIETASSNMGMKYSWGRLLSQVKTDYFCFFGAHDLVSENYFKEIYKTIQEGQGNAIFCANETRLEESPEGWIPVTEKNQYVFSDKPRVRLFQLIFYLNHATEAYGVFPASICNLEQINSSKTINFDHPFLITALTKVNIQYVGSVRYIRRYRKNYGDNFTHKNSANEFQSRDLRVSGSKIHNLHNKHAAIEILRESKISWTSPVYFYAYYMLRLKYSKTSGFPLIFVVNRFLFGKFTPWKI